MMRNLSAVLALSMLTWGCQTLQMGSYARFGAPQKPGETTTLTAAVAMADRGDETPVWVQAEIADVCQSRGCWMMLSEGGKDVRVKFTASEQCTDGFMVPRNATGRTAYVHGVVRATTIPEDMARHYAEESGKSKDEVDKIIGPQPSYMLVATSVWISDRKTLDPPLQ